MNSTRFLTAAAVLALIAGPVAAKPPAHKAAAKPAPAAEAPAAPAAPSCEVKTAPDTIPAVAPAGDTVDTLKASGQFTTFLRAADLTNITLLMKQQKNLTVFAPTDAAFKALGQDQVDLLLRSDHREQLQKLLIQHMIPVLVPTSEFKCEDARAATTLGRTTVQLKGVGVYKVNDADIIQADITTSSGVVHVIDKVLGMPSAAPAASSSGAAASATAPQPTATAAAQPK